jgi:hypothetical protein
LDLVRYQKKTLLIFSWYLWKFPMILSLSRELAQKTTGNLGEGCRRDGTQARRGAASQDPTMAVFVVGLNLREAEELSLCFQKKD